MGNIVSRKYKQKVEYIELLDYIEKLNTENNKQKDELLKLRIENKIQNDKLIAYMHDITMIENSLQTTLSYINSSCDAQSLD